MSLNGRPLNSWLLDGRLWDVWPLDSRSSYVRLLYGGQFHGRW